MKATEFKNSLGRMSAQQLQDTLDSLRRELFSLRLTVATDHVKNYAQFAQLRKNIARVLTCIQQQARQTSNTKQG